MNRLFIAAVLLSGCLRASAQSLDDLKLQVHGYASQGFIYTTNNNWNTTGSNSGSAGWNETVVNVTANPEPKLRVGVQARYFLLGSITNKIVIDWAQGDYKVNEKFGFRVGKVKSPIGLLNEEQDIDPAYLWVLLPQSIYPLASRNATLAHFGGVAYGTLPLGESFGKLEYRGFGGDRVLPSDDGYLLPLRDQGITVSDGISGPTFGGNLRWHTPIAGLIAGGGEGAGNLRGQVAAGPYPGTVMIAPYHSTLFFGKYERDKFMFSGEYQRLTGHYNLTLPGISSTIIDADVRSFYAMTSYRLTGKLAAGMYYSSTMYRSFPTSNTRYQKDWTLSARYDFSPYLYAKAEQHFIDGTAIGFSTSDNPTLQPNNRMTLLKFGVSF